MPLDQKTKSWNRQNIVTNSIKTLKIIHIKKNLKKQNTTQMSLSMRKKQSHRHRDQTCVCQGMGGMGEGRVGSLGLADTN